MRLVSAARAIPRKPYPFLCAAPSAAWLKGCIFRWAFEGLSERSTLHVGGFELGPGCGCTGDPAQTISFSLYSTKCCVVEGLWFSLGVRGVEREVDHGVQAELLEPSAEGSCVDMGLTDLVVQCKTVFVFLRGTQCRVAEKTCLPLVVSEVDCGMQAELLAPSVGRGLVGVSAEGWAGSDLGLD